MPAYVAGKKVKNVYDYTYVIAELKIGKTVSVVIVRDGKKLKLNITPGSRE